MPWLISTRRPCRSANWESCVLKDVAGVSSVLSSVTGTGGGSCGGLGRGSSRVVEEVVDRMKL